MEGAGGGREKQAPAVKSLRKKEEEEAAEAGVQEVMNKKKSDLKIIKEATPTTGGKQQKSAMQPAPASPETAGGVKLLCRRSYSAESLSLKQRLTKTVKEHRARFYIMRRCIQMLICWRDEY
uniref:Uncharacterized protein n=1 Tax=Oryza brachyantha TaxID=4533 RepID=J3M3A0_ORYBR